MKRSLHPSSLAFSPVKRGLWTWVSSPLCSCSLWIPACAGKTVRGGFAVGVGEAVLDEVLGCVHSVADFDAGGFVRCMVSARKAAMS